MSLAPFADYWARWQPDAVAVQSGHREVTWSVLDARTDAIAAHLHELGVVPGGRIALAMLNCPEFVAVVVAAMKLGAVVVPLNVRLTGAELAYMIEHARARVILTDVELHNRVTGVTVDGRPVPVVLAGELGALPVAAWTDATIAEDAPLTVCYTSGTTGHPKGAVLTHRSWYHSVRSHCLQHGINRDDCILLPYPMAFTGGFVNLLMAYWSGARLVIEPAFDAARTLHLIEHERVTLFGGVPIIFEQLANHSDFAATDLSSLRVATTGGAPVPVSLLHRYLDRGVCLIQNYSLTEVSAGGSSLPPQDALRKAGSAGVSALGSETRIVDERGMPLPQGDVGEICVRGPEVMAGYLDDAEATAATLRDGWCFTGDLGYLDDEGYLYVVDRLKDMLISGGLNVYPAEIERLVAGLPTIVEVAVIGVPDRRWGEAPAVVAYTAGQELSGEEVLEICQGELADFKMPRYLVVRDEPLPRNMAGKVQKRVLQQELHGLQDSMAPIR